jgi:hypothetical protein
MREFVLDKMLVSIRPAAGSVLAVTLLLVYFAICHSQKYDLKNMGEIASSRDLIWIHFNIQQNNLEN